ncbi:glycogen synthesis protein GlgS [Raoultella planticola]
MNKQNLDDSQNYDFLAKSFAQMYVTGHTIDIETITGNMPREVRKWFLERYEYYCEEALNKK